MNIGTDGGGTDAALADPASGPTGPNIEVPSVVVVSTVMSVGDTSSIVALSTDSGMLGVDGNAHAVIACTSCLSCRAVMTTKLVRVIQNLQSMSAGDSSIESARSGSLETTDPRVGRSAAKSTR